MLSRLVLPACVAMLFFSGAGCRREETAKAGANTSKTAPAPEAEALPAPAAGQVALEVELLRAPVQAVAEGVFAGSGDPAEDAAFRERLLTAGATAVLRCSVRGAAGQELEENKLETTIEPLIFVFSQLWHQQGAATKEGKELPQMTLEDYEGYAETHETGHYLHASLTPAEGGILAQIHFRWMGTPVIREITSWPVQGKVARVIHDRKWETTAKLTFSLNQAVLLAAAPEPPEAEGKPTGFMLLAFVKAAAGAASPAAIKNKGGEEDGFDSGSGAQTVQAWTLEAPAALVYPWLAQRRDPAGDGEQFAKWLPAAAAGKSGEPSLVSLEVLRQPGELNADYFVDSRLEWQEPRGFEPADTRDVKFVPVPNECRPSAVAHRLECRDAAAILTLPSGEMKRTRWYGSTRGAKDEPVGVETCLNGSSEGGLFTGREPGKIFLAAAHPHGTNMRLVFVRTLGSAASGVSSDEHTLTILETPPDPWLPRLTAGPDSAPLVPELIAAAAEGRAAVLHDEVCVRGPMGWKREATRPWLCFVEYLNPSIHDGKFCFNPRFVYGSAPDGKLEMEQDGRMDLTVSGEPVDRHFGLWLTGLPDYNAENSGVSLPEWPELHLQGLAPLPPGRQMILAVSLGRSWKDPAQRVLHWFILRRSPLTGRNHLDAGDPLPPLPVTSLTIQGKDGAVLEHVTLAGTGDFHDGRLIQTIQPEKLYGDYDFVETVPADVGGPGTDTGYQSIVQTLDGTAVTLYDGQWTLRRSQEHARKITSSVTGQTEQPLDGGYAPAEPAAVSCERLVLRRENFKGALPAAGASATQELEGGRRLTVRVR